MKALLVSLALATCTVASASSNSSDREAWRDACELSRYTCKGIRPPMVRESVLVDVAGLYGLYFGGNTVWLKPELEAKLRHVVTVHEMVHYLQAAEDGKGPPFASQLIACLREEEAYEISDRVAKRLGIAGHDQHAQKLRDSCSS